MNNSLHSLKDILLARLDIIDESEGRAFQLQNFSLARQLRSDADEIVTRLAELAALTIDAEPYDHLRHATPARGCPACEEVTR